VEEAMNIDVLNKWLSAGASIAVIVGVVAAIVGVLVATRTLEETQGAASATLVLEPRKPLEANRDAKIAVEIQDNVSDHVLRKVRGGNSVMQM
jgi:hypothetical protein